MAFSLCAFSPVAHTNSLIMRNTRQFRCQAQSHPCRPGPPVRRSWARSRSAGRLSGSGRASAARRRRPPAGHLRVPRPGALRLGLPLPRGSAGAWPPPTCALSIAAAGCARRRGGATSWGSELPLGACSLRPAGTGALGLVWGRSSMVATEEHRALQNASTEGRCLRSPRGARTGPQQA